MSYLEVFGVLTGVGVDVKKFSELEQEQESQRMEQERSHRGLKNMTPLISGVCTYFIHKNNNVHSIWPRLGSIGGRV